MNPRTIRTAYPYLAADIGKRIRKVREKLEIPRAVLSRTLGKSDGYVSQVENGYIVPSLPALHCFADALRMEIFELLPKRRDGIRWSK